jgi:benzoyl-CoA reductase/2-hydroxyglutaryl-CoA dehydratase subunit BcrC/BadD/HgdB
MQVTTGAMVMDRDEALERLPRVLEAADNRRYEWRAKSPKRVLLAGGVCDHPDIYDTVENAGGAVVGDDLCTGSRWFEAPIPLDGDPLDRLADRLADRPICPAKHASITRRAERLVALAKERRADGVIFIHLKFCDPHAFDYPYLREALEEAGVKSLLFEVEEQPPGVGQMETRFETFMHML